MFAKQSNMYISAVSLSCIINLVTLPLYNTSMTAHTSRYIARVRILSAYDNDNVLLKVIDNRPKCGSQKTQNKTYADNAVIT